jgi:ATP-dependent Lhr-like helicase
MPAASTIHNFLPRSFGAFFGRFARLTPVQEQGIPPILEGRDALLMAPSAAGKTEAYLAPLVERLLSGRERGALDTLVVSPTRALANDLRRRMEGPLSFLGVGLGRYTGEHKERTEAALREVTIATPEALDSLIARRPQLLASVHAIVLDEIHLLDGTPRGDQLRILLHRLRAIARSPLQHIAASATVADAPGLAGRYLDGAALIEVPGTRPIHARGYEGSDPGKLAAHVANIAAHGFRKILVFCNTRNDVEKVANGLLRRTPFGDAVFPHHGSLSRASREHTERRFLEAPAAVAVATLTLELGIDIGTVDYVLLVSPPPGVDSLLQRIGRGNRRTGIARVGYVYDSEGERLLYHMLLERAVRGDLCAAPYAFRPGVLVQQALVLAGSAGHVTSEALSRIIPPALLSEFPGDTASLILERLTSAGLLEHAPGGRYVLTERADRRYAAGRLHGNILSIEGVNVVDRLTGDVVGAIAPGAEPGAVRLGGRGRLAVAVRERAILTDVTEGGGPARFIPRGIPAVSFALARALASELGVGEKHVLQGRIGNVHVVLHGLGTAGAALLATLAAGVVGKARMRRVTPFTLILTAPLANLPRPGPEDVARVVSSRERRLAALCGMGPYHRYLPTALRRAALERAADLDGVARFLGQAALASAPESKAPPVWLEL